MARFSSGLITTPVLTSSMVTSIDVDFEPSVGIMARKFDKLGLDIRSFKEPLTRAVRQVMIPSIQQNFAVGGRPAWEELADDTVRKKLHKGQSTAPLVATGLLQRTMSYLSIWHIDTEKAMIVDLPQRIWYGKVHQAGMGEFQGRFSDPISGVTSNIGDDGSIPARPFVVMQPQDEGAIDRIFMRWLDERIARAGLR